MSTWRFRSARRWVTECKPGEGKYLATYELDSPAVLESPAYLARFNNQSPWSRRCLGKAIVFRRWACEQAGSKDPHPDARALFLAFNGELNFRGRAPLQERQFLATTGEVIFVYELAASVPGAYRLYQP
jgi:hypothetical protein